MGKYYFLISLLPAMPAVLGEKLSLPFAEISRIVRRNIEPEDAPLVEGLLMAIDVTNFENFMQGRLLFAEGGLLSREEVEERETSPSFSDISRREGARDSPSLSFRRPLGAILYRGLSLAQERDCRFLADYLSWETGLRNQLVLIRAREKEVEVEDHLVLPRAGHPDFSLLVSDKKPKSPLAAERLIDEERLRAIFHFEGGDPFSKDAILAHLARAGLLSRGKR